MTSVLKKALSLLIGNEPTDVLFKLPKGRPFKQLTERELIRLESEIGGKIFGPIPAGGRREFFCLDKTTWIWHEEFPDELTGDMRSHTVRYEIQDRGILKAHDGAQYSYLEGEELDNLHTAVQVYYEQVARNVYQRDPATKRKLV